MAPSWRSESDREKYRTLQKAKARLKNRMKALVRKLRMRPETFRRDEEVQVELLRVVNHCTKLGVPLHYSLEDEVLRPIMES